MTAVVEVLRIGQRPVRDDRITTHAALVSRAFGASRIYMTEANPEIRGAIQAVNRTWGGRFEVTYVDRWQPVLHEKKRKGHVVVNLTMYGEPINEMQEKLRLHMEGSGSRDILVIIGAEKVPRSVYEAADYNVSAGGQPHSEIAALAVLLDRIYGGRQFETEFAGARRRIIPSRRGKAVESAHGEDGLPGT